jgi:hypothetical protein
MFQESRNGTWLQGRHTMLSKMTERITRLREKLNDKTGVVEKVAALVNKRWTNCAGCKVIQLEEEGSIFTVVRPSRSASENDACYNINGLNKRCDCGVWQDHGVPCIHAVAYYKLHKRMMLEQVMNDLVPSVHTYEYERSMLKKNVVPICMNTIQHDRTTLPPGVSDKRSAGRPKIKRIRKRSQHAHEPEKSNIVCSICRELGHNVRTCEAREALARKDSRMDIFKENNVS